MSNFLPLLCLLTFSKKQMKYLDCIALELQ